MGVIEFIAAVNTPENRTEAMFPSPVKRTVKQLSAVLKLVLHFALKEQDLWLISKTEGLFLARRAFDPNLSLRL